MEPYILVLVVVAIIAAVAFAIYYYLRRQSSSNLKSHRPGRHFVFFNKFRKKRSLEEDYVWLGPGEHPFKGKKEEK